MMKANNSGEGYVNSLGANEKGSGNITPITPSNEAQRALNLKMSAASDPY